MEVTIVGHPGRTNRQPKHICIYAPTSCGKTCGLKEFAKKYNADVVTHLPTRNDAQFYILDEPQCLEDNLDVLMNVTSGSACSVRESTLFTGDFNPRSDAQVIIASNRSLYSKFAELNEDLNRKAVPEDIYRALKERFTVYAYEPVDYPHLDPRC